MTPRREPGSPGWWVRLVLRLWIAALVVFFPWLPKVPLSFVGTANQAGEFALIAISLVILTGWVGQISLGQATFVGIGAFTTGLLARELHIPFPVNLPLVAAGTAVVAAVLGLVALRVRGLYLAVATLIFAWMADAYLFTSAWFVGKGGSSAIEVNVVGRRGSVTSFDLNDDRILYLVILAAVAATLYVASNLRDSKTGRAFFAVRGSEIAAVSLGIDVNRYKLLAFALSGALAGIAGNLTMIDLRTASPVSFEFTKSLFFLSIAVVGGVTSLGGALAAGLLFAALNEVFFRVAFLEGWLDIVAVGMLLVVLLVYPGGLGALGPHLAALVQTAGRVLRRPLTRLARAVQPLLARPRRPVGAAKTNPAPPKEAPPAPSRPRRLARGLEPVKSAAAPLLDRLDPLLRRVPLLRRQKVARRSIDMSRIQVLEATPTLEELSILAGALGDDSPKYVDWRTFKESSYSLPPNRTDRKPILEAKGITVIFGGLTAVNDMSLEVREHEIVGLIGPNGAGKTTCFNAISGLNEPAAGRIRLFEEDATDNPVHVRAQMGVGRTFQLIQLFPQLTVFENLLVATHVHNHTGVISHLLLNDRAVRTEAEMRRQVRQIVGLLGLEEFSDRRVAGLPFGILRQVEIARALTTSAPFLMLDEPASGLDNAETEDLTRLLYFIRAELGVSILLIEHDVRMVMSVSDYMYVISRGVPLAEGTPAEIQRHPEVIAAYLGEAEAEVVAV